MHYLSAEGLTKSYGIIPLFKNISFHINEGDKIGLIARNGVGKSTLLKILAGKETPDEGKLWVHKDVKVALFEQQPEFDENASILDNVLHESHPVIQAIRSYEQAVEAEDADRLATAFQWMDEVGGWSFDAKVGQIFAKLNLKHHHQKVATLSGGQRKRVALARTLIDIGFESGHTLLMMDEPTNHLDVEMIEWLEHYLNQEKVTLLLVTHDRYFLDAVCDEIWELDRSDMQVYRGDYEYYMETKAARMESEQASIEKARNTYRKELEWMRKQPKARTTKSKSRQDNFYKVAEKAGQKIEDTQMQLEAKMTRLGGKVVELKKVYKSYGEKKVIQGFDYTFSKGERIGVVGKNGAGKSTLLNIIQQIETADSGKINIGETVVFGNFSQQGLEVKDNVRVIEYVKSIAESFPLAGGGSLSAAQFLELFLFPGDKQYTFIESLSGGEKKRLQLLTILFRNPNFLILDEPTNDLDLPTLSVLENFLMDYQGCILIVSHDRYFMDRLVDHLFVFEGDGKIRDFPGNYSQYRIWQKQEEARLKLLNESKGSKTQPAMEKSAPAAEKKAPGAPKASYKEKREFEQLEKEIAELEAEKAGLEEALGGGSLEFEQLSVHSRRIAEIIALLEEKELRWLELSELMD